MQLLLIIILLFALSLLIALSVYSIKQEKKTKDKTIELMDYIICWIQKDLDRFN